ncbi:unnamed protein product [Lymnaea stagnalis]|uniref:PRORP domain-containing protein n=1 Tax=Lymnaea stagnalis TaxID=6523 RepID=A0AAV2H3S0_LYMST
MFSSRFTSALSQMCHKNFNIQNFFYKKQFCKVFYGHSNVSCNSFISQCSKEQLKHVRSGKHLIQPFTFARFYCQQTLEGNEPVKKKRDIMYKPMRKERLANQELFRNILSQKGENPMSVEDWACVESLFLSKIKEKWEIFCMHTLYLDKNVKFGKSLMSYLESKPTTPNVIAMTFFIGLLGQTCNGSDEQEAEVKKYFDILLSNTDTFDAASIEILIQGLSKTKYYLECLPLLETYVEFNGLGAGVMAALLDAGMRYHNSDLTNFAMSQFEKGSNDPTQLIQFVSMVVESCLAADNQQGLEDLMGFLRKHMLLFPKTALEEIHGLFQRSQPGQWAGQYGYIHYKGGNCVACGTQMDKIELSHAEFEKLQKVFLDQVIVGSNIFYKSTPDEMKNLIAFVKRKGPFDVVIDGLNVIHRSGAVPQDERIERTVKYFLNLDKRVLILGSKVLSRYTKNIKAMRNLNTYMTSSTKADDAFMMYAALQSGQDTLIVSHDKLRDHRFLLDSDIRHIFNKWLHKIQIYDWFYSRQGEFTVRRRHLFDLGPKKDKGGWHLPENDVDFNNPHGQFSVLCLRNISNKGDDASKDVLPLQIKAVSGISHEVDQQRDCAETSFKNPSTLKPSELGKKNPSVGHGTLTRAPTNQQRPAKSTPAFTRAKGKDTEWFET